MLFPFEAESDVPGERQVTWMTQLALALSYIHLSRVFHRDIKAENVLLSEHGQIKLVDFGMAAVFESSAASMAQSKKGTPFYFSPEKADGVGGYDSKSDMWAAGCILVEIGTGERLLRPIHSDRPEVRQQREARIEGVGRTTGSALLEEVARGLLQFDPKQRLSGNGMLFLLQAPAAPAGRGQHAAAEAEARLSEEAAEEERAGKEADTPGRCAPAPGHAWALVCP